MKILSVKVYSLAVLLLLSSGIKANIKLPALIADNMILQQNSTVALWGWADPGEAVKISDSWSKQTVKTVADAKGNWLLHLKTTKAGGPYSISIKGKNKIDLKNVLLGEVWLCSGQSNMEFTLAKRAGWRTGVFNYEEEVAKADYPKLRMFTVKQVVSTAPLKEVSGSWISCTPETAGDFSAVAYYFGRELTKETGFPVGLIHSSWGGTPAESWTKKEVLESDSTLKPILEQYNQAIVDFPQTLKTYEEQLAQWKAESETAKQEGTLKPAPRKPIDPPKNSKSPSVLYNAMIYPLIPYTFKGVIWYQGESNSDRASQYRKLFPALINSWRKDWNTDFPFYFVQIAPQYQKEPEIRDAQLFTLKTVPKTGMAVITDSGDSLNIHPMNKEVVGQRLALWALAKDYGKSVTYSGPIYKSMKIEGNKIRIAFDYVNEGLVSKGSALREFSISGNDQKFIPAEAKIDGNTVIVWCDLVKDPVAVRFAWKNFPRPNLYNKAGLPASPFRTDNWPGATYHVN